MSASLFDLEHLQQLSYERSKKWATLLDNVCKNETHKEIDLNDLEEYFGPEFDDQNNHDELASMEDDEFDELSINSDILKNVTNITRFSNLFNNKSVALPEIDFGANGENHKLVDLCNQTLPIINEHHRQLKEYGFDRILNSFDKKKIEEKVGSWLNRHNSLYGGDASLISRYNKEKNYKKSSYESIRKYKNSRRKEDESNDTDDTLHSGETARYIRSSRAKAMKNSPSTSTTTMIKTYRLVKSKREALREKYACEQDDDETHIKAIRHRRRIAEIEYTHYECGRSQRSRKHETHTSPSKHIQKRKVLHKRNTCSTHDNSSDSDSDGYFYDKDDRVYRKKLVCCNKHHCTPVQSTFPHTHRSAMKMPPGRSNRICYYSHSLSKSISSSSSSTSFTANYEKRQLMKRNRFYNDSRPCRRESDCRCCNDRKLCEDYIHVADTSTEDWFVENCYSPKKPSQISTNSKSDKPVTSEPEYLPQRRSKKTLKTTETEQVKQSKQELQKKKPKATTAKNNKKVSSKRPDDTFNDELQMAIEASKKLYEQEQEEKLQKLENEIKEVCEPRVTKLQRKVQMEDDDLTIPTESKNNSTIISKDNKNNLITHYYDLETDVKDLYVAEIFTKPNIKAITSEKTKNVAITSTEETFFASTQKEVICNSTAMPNDTQAYSRQFAKDVATKPLKRMLRKKVDKNMGAAVINLSNAEQTNDQIKTNLKRQMAKSSVVIAKDDEIKEKIPKLPTKKTRKIVNVNDRKQYKNEKSVNQNPDSNVNAATSSTVTSTTIRSPDTNSTEAQTFMIQRNVEFGLSLDEHSDCTLVTSTTTIDPPKRSPVTPQTLQEQQPQLLATLPQNITLLSNLQNNHTQTPKGILIYTPQHRSLVPAHSFSNDGDYFNINKEHLSSIIGEKPAEKFLKYYIGRRRFDSNSTIYFKPPSTGILDTNFLSSSESDDDLESLGQYGDLYESFNKTTNDSKNS